MGWGGVGNVFFSPRPLPGGGVGGYGGNSTEREAWGRFAEWVDLLVEGGGG